MATTVSASESASYGIWWVATVGFVVLVIITWCAVASYLETRHQASLPARRRTSHPVVRRAVSGRTFAPIPSRMPSAPSTPRGPGQRIPFAAPAAMPLPPLPPLDAPDWLVYAAMHRPGERLLTNRAVGGAELGAPESAADGESLADALGNSAFYCPLCAGIDLARFVGSAVPCPSHLPPYLAAWRRIPAAVLACYLTPIADAECAAYTLPN